MSNNTINYTNISNNKEDIKEALKITFEAIQNYNDLFFKELIKISIKNSTNPSIATLYEELYKEIKNKIDNFNVDNYLKLDNTHEAYEKLLRDFDYAQTIQYLLKNTDDEINPLVKEFSKYLSGNKDKELIKHIQDVDSPISMLHYRLATISQYSMQCIMHPEKSVALFKKLNSLECYSYLAEYFMYSFLILDMLPELTKAIKELTNVDTNSQITPSEYRLINNIQNSNFELFVNAFDAFTE